MAIDTYEIITYGGGEALVRTFRGVSAIMGENSYSSLQRLTMMVGFLWVLGGAAFNLKVMNSFTWLMGALLVVYIAIVPKVDIVVMDKIDPRADAVVQDVPLGLGFTASALSKIGLYATEVFEMAFHLPEQQHYSKHGTLFGMRLIQSASEVRILNPDIMQEFTEFVNTCVLYDTAFGLYSWYDIQHTDNLLEFFSTRTSKLRRFYINNDYWTCQEGYAFLKAKIEQEAEDATKWWQGSFLRPNQTEANEAAAVAELSTTLHSSYNYLANLSQGSAEIMRQNIMINAVRDAANGLDPVTSYSVSRAQTERVETWKAMGELSLRTLPLLRTVIEILLLAIFPIVILGALIAPKQVVITYAKALVWLQLWAPLYAILHMVLMTYTADSQGNTMDALTLANQGPLATTMAEMGYVAGYLAMSIPMIAYMLVNQGGMMMANLAGGVMTGMQGVAQRGAEEATTGNISFGQVQQDNINMLKNDRNVSDLSGVLMHQDSSGNLIHYSQHGSNMQNNPITASVNGALQASTQTNLTDSVTAAKQNLSQYSESLAQTNLRLEGVSNTVSNLQNQGHSFNQDTLASWEQNHSQTMKLADQFAEKFNVSKEEAITMAAQFNAGITGTAGGKIPLLGGLEASTGLNAALKADGKGASTELSEEQRQWMEESGFSDALRKAESAGEKLVMSYSASDEDTATKQTQAQLQQHSQLQTSTNASLAEAKAWEETMSNLKQNGAAYGVDGAAAVRNLMIDEYGARADDILAQARNGNMEAQNIVNAAAADWAHGASKGLMHNNLDVSSVHQRHSDNALPKTENDIRNEHSTNVNDLDNKTTGTPNVNPENELVNKVRGTIAGTDTAIDELGNKTAAAGEHHKVIVNDGTDTDSVGLVGKALKANSVTGAVGDLAGRVVEKAGFDNDLVKNTGGNQAANMRDEGRFITSNEPVANPFKTDSGGGSNQ